ncbi:MAG TPA: cyclodeaminase/cyclohydrolase family protein [Bacteroidota bacterium]|nr:cyclodeaminase/cyclohydrolase family protein [Bacteroidota bacterium]
MKLVEKPVTKFLDELASNSPAPGGGSVAALAGSLGSALTSMVCRLTIGKKKYAGVEKEMKKVLEQSEDLRRKFAALVDEDTDAFNKLMEAYGLPKESDDQHALRTAAIQEATKEAALVPLSVMNHIIDALALTRVAAEKGSANSISDAGVSAFMLRAAAESAALNVQINLQSIIDSEFVGWRSDEVATLLRTAQSATEEILAVVRKKINEA